MIRRIENAGEPIRKGKDNDYSVFKEFRRKNGVYIFFSKSTKEALYVGESCKNRLGKRISQHYMKRNTGADFYKNYCKEQCQSTESDQAFKQFESLLGRTSIFVILPDGESGDEESRVKAIEIDLIRRLAPKYNSDIQTVRHAGVGDDVKMILECIDLTIAMTPTSTQSGRTSSH